MSVESVVLVGGHMPEIRPLRYPVYNYVIVTLYHSLLYERQR